MQWYNIFIRFAIGFRGRFYDFCKLRLFNRVLFRIIYWSSEHYPIIITTWKTTKTAPTPVKTVPNISPVTQWCMKNITCIILLSHVAAEAPTAACAIIYLSLLKQAVFIVEPIYCSIQFTFEMPICFCWRFVATEEFFGNMKQYILLLNTMIIWNIKTLKH